MKYPSLWECHLKKIKNVKYKIVAKVEERNYIKKYRKWSTGKLKIMDITNKWFRVNEEKNSLNEMIEEWVECKNKYFSRS